MALNIQISGKLVQFLGTVFANIGAIVYGFMVGWLSPTMPKLSSEHSPLPSGPLTKEEVSLVASIMMLGGLVGTIIFGWLSDHFGRKWPLVVGMFPHVIALLLIATAQNTMYLYISRFLSGISGGALFVITSVYVNEISENSNRGMLGSILGTFYNVGVIIAYAVCAYVPFYTVPYIALGILACFTLFIFFPESPQYLLLKHRYEDAEKSLKFFRGYSSEDQIKQEFESLKSSVAATSNKTTLSLQDFKPTTTRKALIVSFILLCGRNFSGVFPLMNYTVDIFQQAGTDLDPHIAAIIAAAIQLVGAIVAAYLTDKYGRRILLISSLICVGVSLTTIGVYFLLIEQGYNMSHVSWLPVVALSGTFFPSSAVLNIPVYVMSELLPAKIRGSVVTVYMASVWPVTFLLLQYYTPLADLLGVYSCMWIFAGWCFFEAVFAYFMQPETKGKSADEIVLALGGKVSDKGSI